MSSTLRRSALRAAAVLTATGAVVLATAAPAFAHVTAQPGTAEQGGYSVVTLRVPTESDPAGTVELRVTLPADHPITSVRTTPRPGWTATMTRVQLDPPIERNGRTITEAVSTVTWRADQDVWIGPGEYADFPLSLGPLPTDTDTLLLPAVQMYDDGEVVAWDQPPGPDGAEPERPAPSVTLTPAGGAEPATDSADDTARWLGGAGLLVGALGAGPGRRCAAAQPRFGRPSSGGGPMRATARGAALVLVCAVLALLGAGQASAHTRLLSSDPADGTSLGTGPSTVSLVFNENMQAEFSTVTVVGPDRTEYQSGAVTADQGTLRIGVAPLGAAGRYEIGYRVISEDGHPVTGSVAFTLTADGPAAAAPAPTSAPGAVAPAAAAEPAAPAEDGGTPVWPWIVGAVVLVGGGVVAALRLGRT